MIGSFGLSGGAKWCLDTIQRTEERLSPEAVGLRKEPRHEPLTQGEKVSV